MFLVFLLSRLVVLCLERIDDLVAAVIERGVSIDDEGEGVC